MFNPSMKNTSLAESYPIESICLGRGMDDFKTGVSVFPSDYLTKNRKT